MIQAKRLTPEALDYAITYYTNNKVRLYKAEKVRNDFIELLAHITYLDGQIATLKDAQPRVVPFDFFDQGDNLRLCKVCNDRYTTSSNGLCTSCQEQKAIDDGALP